MKLSIVIVSWNVKENLLNCLRSIEENRPCSEFEIIVVDNASSDGTVDAIKHNFPEVTVIANNGNRGFAAANNQGLAVSQGEYVLLLNPDTIMHPNSLDVLIKFMDDNKDVGACGPKLLNDDGTIQHSVRRFPTFRGALYKHRALKFLRIFRSEYKKWLMEDFKYDKQIEVDQPMGAALMIRQSVIDQVGNMDERFFMYYEEVDLCYRIKRAGWHIVFIPEAVITHLGERSARWIPVKKRIMGLTSLLHYFRKHRSKFATGIFCCILKPVFLLQQIRNIAVSPVTYIFATIALNKRKREKSEAKIKKSAILLAKYSWQILFKI